MTSKPVVLSGLAMAVLASWAIAKQQVLRSPRDRASASSGAQISGMVVTGDVQPIPVRRAVVTMRGAGLDRSAITDDDGRFMFDGLPAGQFTLTASRKPFLTAAYGAKRPGHAGTPISVARDQRLTPITMRIVRGAVLAGTVVDQSGDPIPNTLVSVLRAKPSLPVEGAATTDDLGQYRVYGLPPGSYLITVAPRVPQPGPTQVMSDEEVDRLLRDLRERTWRGTGAPGVDGSGAGSARSLAIIPARRRPVTYAPMYYPGSSVRAEASTVTVSAGEERTGLDIRVVPVPSATIDGIVYGVDGDPLTGAQLTLAPIDSPFRLPVDLAKYSASGFKGEFMFVGVPPGQYRITATMGGRATGRAFVPGPTRPTDVVDMLANLFATVDTVVDGEDITGVALALQPGLKLSGRIGFDATLQSPPKDLTSARVRLTPVPAIAGVSAIVAPVKANGTFEFSRLVPGQYQVSANAPGGGSEGWMLKSAVADGRDLLDAVLDVGRGAAPGECVVTLSDRHSELNGMLEIPDGSTAADYSIVVLAADRAYWRPQSRRVRLTRSATDGRYVVRDLPAGSYFVAAVDDIEPDDLDDAEFLERIAAGATAVALAEGERKSQNIAVARR